MPKRKTQPQPRSNGDGFHVSYATIGALAGIIAILGVVVGIGEKVATKSDIESIKATITPTLASHESRIRDIELQMAARFGASPTSAHQASDDTPKEELAGLLLTAFDPQSAGKVGSTANRRVVVPQALIDVYKLQPSPGGAYGLLGEDGRLYSLDDVLAVLIKLHMDEPQFQQLERQRR